ncbi:MULTISPECIES: type VI secretion system Vgr family protein [Acinetobacter]|uniref:Type VI secretion system tip protein VgrG n=1 Tax=Acinetobacter chengduensis TaxID=2420890 RepID=A0ABX9U0B7_9GAMM|nr:MULTISPECIES: type VI secretion system Vgr family protein [Acinetobacter]MBI1451416.1 type VI secretion system tip protein VgrG [Acinetobacter sp. FL51]RKG42087.1 type VI secretion system tip protein VgrG [Acinetobacter sp. WCHAc060007]RLL24651.1 type VI secretion system tip protein VgrG [Acinetobacter chengduensis]
MLSNIFVVLEKLGLSPQKRALHIQFSNPALNTQVFLQRIDGEHALNQGLHATLICLSTHALIPLKQLIGAQVAVDQVTDQGELFRITGIITEASQGQSDGSLTLYKLTLEDATSLWHKRRNSRVFMNKSVLEVSEILFKEWQTKSSLFASSLSLDLSGLSQSYDVRPFIMQSNETDYDFLTRLWRSEGINWLIDETQLRVPHSSVAIEKQKFRLIDDNNQYRALTRRNIRFHRSSATEKQDSITSFMGDRSLQPTAVHVQRWQADSLSQEEGAGSVQSKHQHSQNQDNASLSLEQAWHVSPAWVKDLKGEDQATEASNQQIEKLNQNLTQYHELQSKKFTAQSTVRDTQVGYWFELNEHPEIDQHSGADKQFLIIEKKFYNQNNLPKDLAEQVSQLIEQSQWNIKPIHKQAERQANQLILQRRNITIVPVYNPLEHRPNTHPQRAKVVGPSGEEIHVDAWGRIKVRFLFTRGDDHSHDGGAGSNDNDTDSAWVDVLTPWAGEGYGARFLPRIGEIVVIDFFDGNIDRPFVVGRIHEAQRSPTQFDNQGKLPDTKKLAGIKSKEVQGQGFGQLRFDDTTGQIATQLQSTHGATQLNLGNLSHPKETAESEGRGEGFELRTDQWGAVRAGQGLLLTTHSQQQAVAMHLDTQPAKQQIEANLNSSKALSEVAKNQQTDPLEVLDNLKNFLEQIEKGSKEKADAFKQALMILSAPNSIAISSNEDVHLSADGQISHSAGDSINLSSQNSLIAHAQSKISLFAAQEGLRAYAGKGKVEIQAQGDGADLIARKGIQIISTEDSVEIKASKKIVLTAGGSQIEISSVGVLPTTAGKFEVKAGQHTFVAGAKVDTKMKEIPLLGLNYLNFFATDKAGNQLPAGTGYVLYGSDGTITTGKLSEDGYIKTPPSNEPKEYSIIIDDPRLDVEERVIEESE